MVVGPVTHQHSWLGLEESHKLLGQESPNCQKLSACRKEWRDAVGVDTNNPLCQQDYMSQRVLSNKVFPGGKETQI